MSPETAYRSDKKPQRFIDPDTIAQAFLHFEDGKLIKPAVSALRDKSMRLVFPSLAVL
jgi:putative transposase